MYGVFRAICKLYLGKLFGEVGVLSKDLQLQPPLSFTAN